MKTYEDFERAVNKYVDEVRPIYHATDVYKAAENAGFTREEIIKYYGRYREENL